MFVLKQGHFSGPVIPLFPKYKWFSEKYFLRNVAGPWGEIAFRPRGRRG